MQTGLLGFQRAASGLLSPAPRGLVGFQRQTMAQTKKGGPAFMGMANTVVLGAPLPIPVEATPGDLLIYQANANSSPWVPSNDASWTTLSKTDVGGTARWKIMDGSDRSATTPGSGSVPGAAIWAFRGVASVSQVAQLGDSTGGGVFGTVFNIGGFTKSAKHLGLFVFAEYGSGPYSLGSLTGPAALAASPKLFYSPADRNPVPTTAQYPRLAACTLDPTAYTSGASLIWDVVSTSWGQAFVAAIELRGA